MSSNNAKMSNFKTFFKKVHRKVKVFNNMINIIVL